MDSFGAVRANARELHAELVARGVDPLSSVALVDGATAYLELEVTWLPEDDPALNGAIAVYDQESGTIRCADRGEPPDRLLVVAHEIGHARLHPVGAGCVVADIDASRSMEAAPVGLQRVEDYGAHERRELQADVFARELVLPRSMARRLHLDDALPARIIAERLGLPLNLVRQQILDAVLLPEPPLAARSEVGTVPSVTDESQERAAAHRGSAFLLQAGPGTGKTSTLIRRVSMLLAQGVDPAEILILTFSNRAAGELVDRISALAPEAAPRMWTGTFHAFGLDLIRRYHDRLDLTSDPALFDRSDAVEVLEEILPTLPLVHYRNLWDPTLVLRDIVGAVSRAKDELADPVRYRDLAQAMLRGATDDPSRVAAERCLEIATVYSLYEDELRRRKAVDFGDLIMRPALLLESDSTIREAVRARHRHVLIDEYQDVNRASARLLRAVAGEGRSLWVVGDSRQAIYRFRGASSRNLSDFVATYPDAATAALHMNYRSSQEIIDAYTGFSKGMEASEGMIPLALRANRGPSSIVPEVRSYETAADEFEGTAANIRALERHGIPLRDQAILCRTNAKLNDIAAALEIRGIPILHLGSLFERDEVRDLLALLSLAVDSLGEGIVRIATKDRYRLQTGDMAIAIRRFQESEGPALAKLAQVAVDPGLSSEGAAAIERLTQDLTGLARDSTPWEFLTTWMLDRTRHVADLGRSDDIVGQLRGIAVWQLLNFVRDQGPALSWPPIRRLLDRVRQLVLFADERDLRQIPAGALHIEAVRLMTVHGSKGLEFEAVHVPGLTVQSFPANWQGLRCPPPAGLVEGEGNVGEALKAAQLREEECLFFVALSRARTHLSLTLNRTQGERSRSPSPFLEGLGGSVKEIGQPAQLALPAGVIPNRPLDIRWPADWKVTDQRLKAYSKCPRRFFYTHVLGLGSARKATAFTRTHDCLYRLIGWLVNARVSGDPSPEAVTNEFERLWSERGPVDHAYAADYHLLAGRLVSQLIRLGADKRFRSPEAIALNLPTGEIWVEPDEMAELPDGTVILRRVRTGHKRKEEYDELEYALYHLAGRAKFGSSFQVEAVHLGDELMDVVAITERKIAHRREVSDKLLANLRAGAFPPKTDAVSCPRCPHFFICDVTPAGPYVPV